MSAPAYAEVRAVACGRWPEILSALGVPAETLRNRFGPCPGCGGKDRFRFDDRDGRGTWICGGGGDLQSGDGFDLLAHVHGWSKGESLRQVADRLGVKGTDDRAARRDRRQQAQAHRRSYLESAFYSELLIIVIGISSRLSDREKAADRAYMAAHPEFRPMPDEPFDREIEAVQRLLKLIPLLYQNQGASHAA